MIFFFFGAFSAFGASSVFTDSAFTVSAFGASALGASAFGASFFGANAFFTISICASSTELIWLFTSTPFLFKNSTISLLCLFNSFANSYIFCFAIYSATSALISASFSLFSIDFANPSSVTAREARNCFPMECPRSSLVP